MTVELVLLLGLYAFIILGAFLGPLGPVETFRRSGPRLGAKIERNIAVGTRWTRGDNGVRIPGWVEPPYANDITEDN